MCRQPFQVNQDIYLGKDRAPVVGLGWTCDQALLRPGSNLAATWNWVAARWFGTSVLGNLNRKYNKYKLL